MASSLMSTERALRIIDRHLVRPRGERSGSFELADPRIGTADRRGHSPRASASLPRHQPCLPAFRVGTRDGPSPFDAHRGDAQRTVDEIWASRQDFAVADKEKPSSPPATVTAAHRTVTDAATVEELVRAVATGEATCTLRSDYFRNVTHPPVVEVVVGGAGAGGQSSQPTEMANPSRDRVELQRQLAAESGDKFIQRMRKDRDALCTVCVRKYPHGALGLRESPYGPQTGEVYSGHSVIQGATHRRETRKLYGHAVAEPEDHLRGSIVMRERGERYCQHVANIAPRDNLLGAVIVE